MATNTSGEQAGQSAPRLVRGASATRLYLRGNLLVMTAGLMGIPLGFESDVKSDEDLYKGLVLAIIGALLVTGGVVTWWSHRKERVEIAHGYTSVRRTAAQDPSLYLVDHTTLAVLTSPRRSDAVGS